MDLYDEEIRYLDEELQQLFIALYDRGLLGQTMIVLAADHGEEFLEHDHIKHCRSLYEPEVRTPLVFWIPGVEAPRRIGELAQNLDIVPTVLDYMGIEDEALQPVGRSLRRTIESGEPTNRYTFSAQDELQTVSDGPHKLIVDHGDESRQLFDLAADPLERVDLSGRRPEIEADLEQALRDYDQTSRSELLDRADRTHENLRALGYLE
jgi:arylsulfatase A-like enzyme